HKAEKIKGKPSIIICNTIKGKGVSFFENKVEYHGVAPTDEELEGALKEL
ncbi:MAG: transketolase, partial [Deltaproteobacteria bacterium]|nr:transketolase [Deltaproteobacteria bacterium]